MTKLRPTAPGDVYASDRIWEQQSAALRLTMPELARELEQLARPRVAALLDAELRGVGAEAWRDEGVHALNALLADAPEQFPDREATMNALMRDLETPIPPDDDEVNERSAQVGRVMAAAWLQFLIAALDQLDSLELGPELLPRPASIIPKRYWDELRGSTLQLPLARDDAQEIMRELRTRWAARAARVELPASVVVEMRSDSELGTATRSLDSGS